jgi:murein DD-endopeptidase MepM/ murein hydrolase activator NlpD
MGCDGRANTGIDFCCADRATVRSVFDGMVYGVHRHNNLWQIMIDHGEFFMLYSGLAGDTVFARIGDYIISGENIGKVGIIADEKKSFLHLEMYEKNDLGKIISNKTIDPTSMLMEIL